MDMKIFGLTMAVVAVLIVGYTSFVVHQLYIATFDQSYFFFHDPDFQSGFDTVIVYWKPKPWNFSSPFSTKINIQNGLASLFYNESGGEGWGGAVLLQGSMPHNWPKWFKPLGGKTRASAQEVEYVEFVKSNPVPTGKFFLEVMVKVTERNYTVFGSNREAVSNVGVDLMFGFDQADYHDPNQWHQVAIHADVLFDRCAWDKETKTETHSGTWSGSSPSPYDGDYHLPLIRGQITQLDTWYTFKIDLAEIIETIFNITGKQTIRYYGAQVFTDGISSYTKAVFDYVKTTLK